MAKRGKAQLLANRSWVTMLSSTASDNVTATAMVVAVAAATVVTARPAIRQADFAFVCHRTVGSMQSISCGGKVE